MPILFVNYHGTLGGGQAHLLAILDHLDRSQFTPQVVCCQSGPFVDQLRRRDLEPMLLPFGKGKRRYLHVSVPAFLKFHKILKQHAIQLVHVSGLQEAKLAAYPCAWSKVPMVWLVAP